MSKSGSGSGVPSDEWPIVGCVDSEDYVCGLKDYVTSMKELIPDDPRHPSDDWLNWGFAMILLDKTQEVTSTPEQGTPSIGETKAWGPPSSQKSSTRQNLAAATTGVANLRLKSKTAHLTPRLKDRPFRVHALNNKAVQFHATDLYDLESCTLEVTKLVKGLAP